MEENLPVVRAMIAFESDAPIQPAITEATRLGGATVTVAAVACPPYWITLWGPLSGVSLAEDRREALAYADASARQSAGLFPDRVAVHHRAERCWRDVLRVAAADGYDVLIIPRSPRRLRDRRQLRRASDEGLRIVVVNAPT